MQSSTSRSCPAAILFQRGHGRKCSPGKVYFKHLNRSSRAEATIAAFCSLAGNWVFAYCRWLDPLVPQDHHTLHCNYNRLCADFPGFQACSRDTFLKVLSDLSLSSSRRVARNSRVFPRRKGETAPAAQVPQVAANSSPSSSHELMQHAMPRMLPDLGCRASVICNAGQEVDHLLFAHWVGAQALLRPVDEEEIASFVRSSSF